jgi:lysozyme
MNHQILLKQLILHEGKKRFPYKDTVGKITIGIGRNLVDVGLSDSEIEYLLENDISKCIRNLDSAFPWWKNLSEVRQHVMIDMIFNLGLAGLSKFVLTLDSIRTGRYELASRQMLASKWATQVGKRATRLSQMMLTDIFPMEIQ